MSQRPAIHAVDRRRLALLLAAVAPLAACDFRWGAEPPKPPTPAPLIDGLQSYLSISEVRRRLEGAGFAIIVLAHSRLPAEDKRPRFDQTTLEAIGYQHLDQDGRLRCIFLNDRLKATLFVPRLPDAYLAALRDVGVTVNETPTVDGTVQRIAAKLDDGRRYVGWIDTRLQAEEREWIARYS